MTLGEVRVRDSFGWVNLLYASIISIKAVFQRSSHDIVRMTLLDAQYINDHSYVQYQCKIQDGVVNDGTHSRPQNSGP